MNRNELRRVNRTTLNTNVNRVVRQRQNGNQNKNQKKTCAMGSKMRRMRQTGNGNVQTTARNPAGNARCVSYNGNMSEQITQANAA